MRTKIPAFVIGFAAIVLLISGCQSESSSPQSRAKFASAPLAQSRQTQVAAVHSAPVSGKSRGGSGFGSAAPPPKAMPSIARAGHLGHSHGHA